MSTYTGLMNQFNEGRGVSSVMIIKSFGNFVLFRTEIFEI